MLAFCKDSAALSAKDVASCHTRKLRRLHVEKMDPSMLIAFLIQSEEDWKDWTERMESTNGTSLIRFAGSRPAGTQDNSEQKIFDEVDTFDDPEEDGSIS